MRLALPVALLALAVSAAAVARNPDIKAPKGSYKLDPPAAIQPYLQHHPELSKELLAIDRSATYGSFYVFTVKGRPPVNGQAEQLNARTPAAVPVGSAPMTA